MDEVNFFANQYEIKFSLPFPKEACVAEWLIPQTPDLEVPDSSLARRIVSLDKELYATLSLFTQD